MSGRTWATRSEGETQALGVALGRELLPDGVLLLVGDLGSGKTVLTRGVAEALGIPPTDVQSPTFNLVREYDGRLGRLTHIDLYRLEPREVAGIGLDEMVSGPGVKVIEWAERLTFSIGGAVFLRLSRGEDPGRREILEELAPDK